MAQKTNTLEEYVKDVGKYLKRVDEHIKFIYSSIEEINKKIKSIEKTVEQLQTETTDNTSAVATLKENTVQKLEFEEFVSRLTEGLKNILPTLPEALEETKEQADSESP